MPQTIKTLLESKDPRMVCDEQTCNLFLELERGGGITRDENPEHHMCVYFAPYDPEAREVFIGHHIKAQKWLFNGGHIDQGETVDQTLPRDMQEEWGMIVESPKTPQLLTMTDINNPGIQTCRTHYDVWYFIPRKKEDFHPDAALLAKEFTQTKWMSLDDAYNIVTDPATHKALNEIKKLLDS